MNNSQYSPVISELQDISHSVIDGVDCIALEIPSYVLEKQYADAYARRIYIMKLINKTIAEAELTEYNKGVCR